jgi:hypothetical protein
VPSPAEKNLFQTYFSAPKNGNNETCGCKKTKQGNLLIDTFISTLMTD